jgi:hypothetical protein
MQTLDRNFSLIAALQTRRAKLAALVNVPVLLWSGSSSPRNFRANTFPFRASSHFLYFAGLPLENAAIRLDGGKLVLFMDEARPGSALWHGEAPKRDEIAAAIGAHDAYPLAELASQSEMATIAVQDATTRAHQAKGAQACDRVCH